METNKRHLLMAIETPKLRKKRPMMRIKKRRSVHLKGPELTKKKQPIKKRIKRRKKKTV